MNQLASEKVKELGLEFPPAPMPIGLYRPLLEIGKFLYVSGQGPVQMDGSLMTGRAGDDLTKRTGKNSSTAGWAYDALYNSNTFWRSEQN